MDVTGENLRRINHYGQNESAMKSMAYRVALLHSLAESFRTFTLDSKHWITKNGTHMQIEDPGGKVVKGPPALNGHNIRKDKRHKQGQREYDPYKAEAIWLEKKEYAHVMSELNTHLTTEERGKKISSKRIGNYLYVFINHGFNNYKFIDKIKLK